MMHQRDPSRCSGPARVFPVSRFLTLAGVLAMVCATPPAGAQNPTLPPPSQAQSVLNQAVQQNPGLADVIRQRLQQSGMTPDQIRARLQASGYSPTLLDAYLSPAAPGATPLTPGTQELGAVQALGLAPVAIPVESLPVDTGLIRALGAAPVVPKSRVFGVDVFQRTTTQFLPLLSGPVPPDYKLGPGDQVALILTGDVEATYSLAVSREGFVLIPQVGQLYVSNLTLDQLRSVLMTKLGRVYSGVRLVNPTTHFDISVVNVRANQVYVVGEVAQPGAYQISSLGTVLTALYAAGGVTEQADMREVAVQRLGKTVTTLDLYDYLLRGDTRSDVRLETGDVVYVPVHGIRAEISGPVKRPAIYEMKPLETLSDLIIAAGGFAPDAQLKRVAIYRLIPAPQRSTSTPPRAVIDVALSVPAAVPPDTSARGRRLGGMVVPTVALADGDSVVVDAVDSLARQYHVGISGYVQKAGTYPWQAGMTLRDLVLLARGPRVGADLREVEIARMPADRSNGQLAVTIRVPLDSSYLYGRDSTGRYVGPPGVSFPSAGSAPEVPLDPFDNVLILRQPNFELQRTVTILGQVRYPGEYALQTKSDRLAGLVQRAGGLTHEAYPEGIRFYRLSDGAGRINVHLATALRDSTSPENLILQPDDSIWIPEYIPTVRITGAVNAPGSVLYDHSKGLDDYVSAAGGFTQNANEGRVSVRYANGEVKTKHKVLIFFSNKPKPDPGAEVFVPLKPPETKTDWFLYLAPLASILASTVAIIAVAKK